MSYNVDFDVLEHLHGELGLEDVALDPRTESALLVFGDDDERVGIAVPATYFEGPWNIERVGDEWTTAGEWTPPEEADDG